MKAKMLRKAGLAVVSMGLMVSIAAGCGSSTTTDAPATEVLEAAVDTQEPEELDIAHEMEAVTEAAEAVESTEELLAEETELAETEEAEGALAFAVTELSAVKYAKQSVNVRKGPSADYEKLGGLAANQKVTVTGEADTGWYRIEYNGAEGYVSGRYLTDQKVTAAGSTSKPAADTSSTAADTSAENVQVQPAADTNTQPAADSNTDVAIAGKADNIPTADNTPVVDNTPSAPAVDNTPVVDNTPSTPAVDNTPVVDNFESLGSIGGAGTWEGPINDGYTNNVIEWE